MTEEELLTTYSYLRKWAGNKSDYIVDGAKMKSQVGILSEIYIALDFSDYLPYVNYDGLVDLLLPTAWKHEKSTSIHIKNIANFLESNEVKDVTNLFEVLGLIFASWAANKGRGSFVIYLS